jgi:hypothetical protein
MCHTVCVVDQVEVPGLCETGLAIYRDALVTGSVPADAAVPCLIDLGLLVPLPGGRLAPLAPATAAQLALDPLRRQIARHRRQVAALEQSFAAATAAYTAAQQQASDEIRQIHGAETISAVLRLTVDGCARELLTVQPGGRRPPELLERALASELPALRRGVAQRTIYQHAIRTHPPTIDYVRNIIAAGAQVRTTDEVVDRMIICDEAVAFIPDGLPRPDRALEVRNPGVISFLVRVFENAWVRAQPIEMALGQLRPARVVGEIDRAIMRFLVEGYTDAKIARQLGVSQRTVATRVRGISDQLGSGSRAQLGYLIATHGLLDQPGPADQPTV